MTKINILLLLIYYYCYKINIMEKLSTIFKNSAIISQKDLERIKRTAQSKTEEDDAAQNQRLIHINGERKAQLHKEKIREYDRSKININTEETEEDRLISIKNREIVENARLTKLKSHDAVKTLDKMILYAKTATIRDLQKKEKEEKEKREKRKEEKLDIEVEIIRLKELKKQEMEIELIKKKRQEAGKIIINQMKEREIEQAQEVNRKELDYKVMLTEVKRMQDEDAASLQKKKN